MDSMNDHWDQAYEMGRRDALKQAIEIVKSACSGDEGACGCTPTAVDAVTALIPVQSS